GGRLTCFPILMLRAKPVPHFVPDHFALKETLPAGAGMPLRENKAGSCRLRAYFRLRVGSIARMPARQYAPILIEAESPPVVCSGVALIAGVEVHPIREIWADLGIRLSRSSSNQ